MWVGQRVLQQRILIIHQYRRYLGSQISISAKAISTHLYHTPLPHTLCSFTISIKLSFAQTHTYWIRLLCPRLGGIMRWSASVVRRLMSRTSALTRKPKGLGRWNFAQGYPRSHATPTPTSRSKGQKSRSRGGVILWRPSSRTAEHQQSCHLANGCRYNVIKILLNTAMLIIIQSNHFRVNSAV